MFRWNMKLALFNAVNFQLLKLVYNKYAAVSYNQKGVLTECDLCGDAAIEVSFLKENVFVFILLYLVLQSSTVIKSLIRISDVYDHQVIGVGRLILHKFKTRECDFSFIMRVRLPVYNKSRLVLMGTVPEPNYIYSSWHFAVTVNGDVVSRPDNRLQHRSRMTPGKKP